MGREERRRAERQQRRAAAAAQAAAASPTGDGSLGRAVLGELGGGKRPPRPAAKVARRPGTQPSSPAPAHAAPPRPAVTTASSLRTTAPGCDVVSDADPQALGLTYTFDAPAEGEARPMTVAFDGRRTGVEGPPAAQDTFSVVETVAMVLPGAGRITVTARAENITAGGWEVTAGPVLDPASADAARPVPALARASGRTGFAPIVRVHAPGVRIGAWPALVAVGAAVALVTQFLLAARAALPQPSVLVLSLLACVVGLVGARVYYVVEHPQRRRGLMNSTGGVCIQGFVLGAVATVVIGALLLGLPVGTLLDVTAPGLLFGMAIGRLGCFFGGCCAGRPTASRWGLWSSDRRLGIRRVPTQLFESTLALLTGLAALAVMLASPPDPAGVVFLGGIAAYTLGRQLLFPLRNQPRNTRHGRRWTAALCGLALLASVATALLV